MSWTDDVTLSIEAGFGSGPLAAAPSWPDVTSDDRSLKISRGRTSIRTAFGAGIARMVVNNRAGDWDPQNTAGAHSPDVDLHVPIRVQAVHDVTTYDLFRGHISELPLLYPDNIDAIARLEATDNIPILNRTRLQTATYAQESTDTRIGNILDDASWPAADRSLDTGVTDVAGFTETFAVYIAANVAGFFTLTIEGETTSNLNFNATAAQVETAVEALASITAATVTGTGVNGDPWQITIDNPLQHSTVTAAGPGLHTTTLLPGTEPNDFYPEWPFGASLIDEPHLFLVSPVSDDGVLVAQIGNSFSGSAWSLLRKTAEAEQGNIFVTGNGDFRFLNRVAFSSPSSAATFGDGGLSAQDITRGYDDKILTNLAEVKAAGAGEPQTASDSTSITAHGEWDVSVTNPSLLNDNAALNVAEWIVGTRKDYLHRIGGFTVYPQKDPANLWPIVLSLELGDVVTINLIPPAGDTYNEEVVIDHISHDIEPGLWTVSYRCHPLSTFETQAYWVLDTSDDLDTNTVLA